MLNGETERDSPKLARSPATNGFTDFGIGPDHHIEDGGAK